MVALVADFPHFIFSSVVRDLGVTLDQELTFAPHLNSLIRSCYNQIRQLRTVARSLTPTATATLVHSFGASRLDYCSCLYTGLPATRLSCLDRVLQPVLVAYLSMTTSLPICATFCTGPLLGSE